MSKNHINNIVIGANMPLIWHLKELRRRLLICVIAFLINVIICYIYASQIYGFLAAPLLEYSSQLIYTNLTEAFFAYLKLASFSGFVLAFPIIAWQVYAFIAPGLYAYEKNKLLPYLLCSSCLFVIGALLAYYYVIPLAWNFFVSFEQGYAGAAPAITLQAKVSDYLDIVMTLIIGFGVAFQMPLVLVLLCHMNIIDAKDLVKYRRHAIVLIFIAAALLTPPDVLSQVCLAIPLMLLYEIAIICARAVKA